MNFKGIFSFYKDCYEADTRTVSLTNIFSSKVENRHFLSGTDELLNEHLPRLPVDITTAELTLENVNAYNKEKSLYLCAFFMVGKGQQEGKRTNSICAPLFFYPAKIEEQDGLYFLTVDKRLAFPNTSFLESHRLDGSIEVAELFHDILTQPFSFETCGTVKRILESSFYNFHAEELLLYPQYSTESALKSTLKKTKEGFRICPAAALGVLKHSTATLGIITELKQMQQQPDYSSAIHNFFNYDLVQAENPSPVDIHVPVILSKAQQNIIESANRYDETVAIGPPGTGKSFTISTLAIDQVNRGNSVLIVSKTDQALDVIDHKIANEIGVEGITVRAGRKQYLKNLKDRVRNILLGLPALYALSDDKARELREKIVEDRTALMELQQKLYDQISDDLRWGEYLFRNKKGGIFSSIVKKYIEWRNSQQEPHWEIITKYYDTKDEYLEDLKAYVLAIFRYQLWRISKHHRKSLRNFSQALRARTLAKQEELFGAVDFNVVLKAFPVWICKLSDLFEVLPFRKELFDVVIIDEASQCDIATCLPALQRAKKVIIVGDPMQLRHYSFLSRGMISHLKNKHRISDQLADHYFDYRDTSILDIYFEKISRQQQVVFLDEHFRGNDSLIRFSNDQFYQGRLKIIKSLPHHNTRNGLHHTITNGHRSKNGINESEATQLVETMISIIEEQEEMDQKAATSIGVLSPFRMQAEFLHDRIHQTLTIEKIEKHKIKIGTPYSFQGDERDVMLISFCVDNASHTTALSYLNTSEMFNVAITRAKFTQYIYSSISNATGDHLVTRYLLSIDSREHVESPTDNEIYDEFLNEVARFFKGKVGEIHKDYLVAGILVDILVHTNEGYFGIDLIGYPGKFYDANSIDQYEILGRAGVKMIPLPYSNWYYEKEKCIAGLEKLIFGATQTAE